MYHQICRSYPNFRNASLSSLISVVENWKNLNDSTAFSMFLCVGIKIDQLLFTFYVISLCF